MITKLNEYITDKNDKQYQFIMDWLKKYDSVYDIDNYIINDNYSVISRMYVDISDKKLTKIEVKFKHIYDSFYCNSNFLTSLEYCPSTIKRLFCFENNPLQTLKGLNINFYYRFGDDTENELLHNYQSLIDELLEENILWYDQFEEVMSNKLLKKYSYYKDIKKLM